MEVTREMEVHLLHRYNLGVATTCSAAFDAEGRTEGGLAEGEDCLFAEKLESLGQSDGHRGLALAEWRRVDSGHEYILCPRWSHLGEGAKIDLRDASAPGLHISVGDPHVVSDIGDWSQIRFSCDFKISFHADTLPMPVQACRPNATSV